MSERKKQQVRVKDNSEPKIADPGEWAKCTFGTTKLGHVRRTRRLVFSAARIASEPEKSFPEIFDWKDLKGFYCLCDQKRATPEAIQGPHREQTRTAMGEHPVVLVLHDTSQIDFTSHSALQGRGPIGDSIGQGFLQHNSLAVLPSPRRLLGLAHQQLRTRIPAPVGESSRSRKRRERESQMWLEGINATGRPPEGCTWVDVGDRGADIYEAMEASLSVGHHFLFRATQDRVVHPTTKLDEEVHLLQYARTLLSKGHDTVEIPGRGGRPARTAKVALTSARVWVPPPKGTPQRKSRPTLPCWVIRVWEPDPPADVKEPLEWVLLSALRATKLAEIKQRRDWYTCRWLVEVYHDVEKNGCIIEERRFETARRMSACLAVLALVALRVLQMRLGLLWQPQLPAEQVASKVEREVLSLWLETQVITVSDFVRGVSTLGGFLARKGDGQPGVRSLWRGYQRLQDMVVGYQLRDRTPTASHSRVDCSLLSPLRSHIHDFSPSLFG